MPEPVILGVDPGLASCGFAVIQGRRVIVARCVRTEPRYTTHVRALTLVVELRALLATYSPALVAIEDYAYYGDRSQTANAMAIPRVVGALEGACEVSGVPSVTLRRVDVLRRLGLAGACDKARAGRWCSSMLTGELPNEHVRDAAMVAFAGGLGLRGGARGGMSRDSHNWT